MIVFEKLRYKNILSVGNVFLEIDLNKSKNTLIVGPNGQGKAQPLSSLVLTDHGWTTMGKIQIGDNVITASGDLSSVTHIHPQGFVPIYKLTFSDGREVRCCGDHLWRVWGNFSNKWEWKTVSIKELLESKTHNQASNNYKYVQLFEPSTTTFAEANLPIDPYLLGVLIGDGCLVESIKFTSFDNEIVERVGNIVSKIPPLITHLKVQDHNRKGAYSINFANALRLSNPISKSLSDIGLLGHKSFSKFIPEMYKNSSLEQRLEIIRGLMDTDGTVGKTGEISYTTTSKRLATDFQEIIHSIGGICKIREFQSSFTYKNEKRRGRVTYTLNIRYKKPSDLFHLTRKKSRCLEYQYADSLKLRINNIELDGEDQAQCITIDSDDHLYVTNGYVVTHNSTVLDALTFSLFGRPFRKINKPQLVNSINGKNMLCEIEFTIGKNSYLIRRGIKPTIFEIFCNGVLINQDSANRDYQQYLEQTILKMNFKSFLQTVVLGSANYVPFMQLTALARRELIEDLLDIQVFSVMNNLLKDQIADNKQNISNTTHQIELLETKYDLGLKHEESINKMKKSSIDEKKKTVQKSKDALKALEEQLAPLNQEVKELDKKRTELKKSEQCLTKLNSLNSQMKQKLDGLKAQLLEVSSNTVCTACHQNLDQSHIDRISSAKKIQISEIEDGLLKLGVKMAHTQVSVDLLKEVEEHRTGILMDIATVQAKVSSERQQIGKLNKEIEAETSLLNSQSTSSSELKQTKQMIQDQNKVKEQLLLDRDVLQICSTLLKDGGVKARIIAQYIPVINKLINKYLSSMDFFIQFELDTEFKEVIRSRFRDEFSYENFSEGEKTRIDLALLFAWRAIAKMRNTTSTNLLVFDEILDSSLDSSGVDDLMKILNQLTSDVNVFIISHRDSMFDKFTDVIKFEKVKGFTRTV